MVNERHRSLVAKLLKKTQDGSINWETSIVENSVQISFNTTSVVLTRYESAPDLEDDYIIDLLNSEGKVVDSISDVDLTNFDNSGDWFVKMKKLYEVARRQALGSDRVLDEIIEELDDIL